MKSTDKKILEEIIRVDHAGERGAIKIYEGQLLALNTFKNPYGTVGTSALAVFKAAPFAAKANCTTDTEGRTNVEHKTTIVKISTCIAAGEDPLNDQLTVE